MSPRNYISWEYHKYKDIIIQKTFTLHRNLGFPIPPTGNLKKNSPTKHPPARHLNID